MKILITTIHPGPYIDKWIEILSQKHKVDAIYFEKTNSEKVWKNYEVKNAYYYSDFSFLSILKFFKSFDFVIFGGWYVKSNIIYAQLLRFTKTKTAFFADHPEIRNEFSFEWFLKRRIIKSSNYLFAASYSTKKYFEKKYKLEENYVKVFPYAHNFDFEPEIMVDENKIKIFIANRFIERKGYKVVLECFKILKDRNKLDIFDITIVGGGPEYNFYKNEFHKISKSIIVLKWIENEDYITFLKSANIYLHASIFEPFGIPPLDAMQLGKIVVASDGVKSINHLKGMSNGLFIYDGTDSQELSNILINLSLDRKLICNGINNFNLITKIYTPQALLEALPE